MLTAEFTRGSTETLTLGLNLVLGLERSTGTWDSWILALEMALGTAPRLLLGLGKHGIHQRKYQTLRP